jgi:hypothetical protein
MDPPTVNSYTGCLAVEGGNGLRSKRTVIKPKRSSSPLKNMRNELLMSVNLPRLSVVNSLRIKPKHIIAATLKLMAKIFPHDLSLQSPSIITIDSIVIVDLNTNRNI